MTRWTSALLGDLCEFRTGLWTGKKPPYATAKVLRNTNFGKGHVLDFSDVAEIEVEERHLFSKTLRENDIIVEKSGGGPKQPVGRVVLFKNFPSGTYSFSNFTSSLTVKDKESLLPEFLYRYLMHFYELGETEKMQSHSTGIRNLNFDSYKKIAVPLPPLREQQRIVGILDQALEGIAKAEVYAERNRANGEELFTNAFDDLLAKRCQNTPISSLASIADFKNGLNFNRSSKGQVIKIVGVADFKNNFWTPDKLAEVQIDASLSEAYELRDNDILVVRSNGNKELIGRCILARGVEGKTSHSGFTIRVRPNSDAVDSEYLTHFMKSSAVRRALVASGDGANISSLNQKALSSVMVPLPPVSVQREIVKDLSVLGEKIGQMKLNMDKKSSEIDNLRKSVFHLAFSGNI